MFALILLSFIIYTGQETATPKEQDFEQYTHVFSTYLDRQFNATIQEEKHYYILVPKLACLHCTKEGLSEFNKIINAANTKDFTLIYTDKKVLNENMPTSLEDKVTIWHDTKGLLDRLNMPVYNVTLLETKGGKVVALNQNSMKELQPFGKWIVN